MLSTRSRAQRDRIWGPPWKARVGDRSNGADSELQRRVNGGLQHMRVKVVAIASRLATGNRSARGRIFNGRVTQ